VNDFLGADGIAKRLALTPTIIPRGLTTVRFFADSFKPGLLPEDQARSLATAVRLAVTPGFQMDGAREPAAGHRVDRVAGLVGTSINSEALAAILKHLRHEGKILQTPIFVQGP
jgi:hypothetical protein